LWLNAAEKGIFSDFLKDFFYLLGEGKKRENHALGGYPAEWCAKTQPKKVSRAKPTKSV